MGEIENNNIIVTLVVVTYEYTHHRRNIPYTTYAALRIILQVLDPLTNISSKNIAF